MGKINTQDLFKKKREMKFLLMKNEGKIYDTITSKYLTTKKTKEEMIKFILRKCFKYLRSITLKEEPTNQKEIYDNFMEQYFKEDELKKTQLENDLPPEQDLLIPFRKNSKIKTMNSSFLKLIFNSEKFYKDYLTFLENFDQIARNENQKKLKKCASIIAEFIEKDNFQKIKNYKRLPWTEQCLQETK